MSLTMIGPVVFRDFNKQLLGQKGISVTGTLATNVPYSSTIREFPFKVVEYGEKNAEFMSKYFFTEKGKAGLAKGTLAFEDGAGWVFLIKEIEFSSFKDSASTSNQPIYEKKEQAPVPEYKASNQANTVYTQAKEEVKTNNPVPPTNFWSNAKRKSE